MKNGSSSFGLVTKIIKINVKTPHYMPRVRIIHQWPMDCPPNAQMMREAFPCNESIIIYYLTFTDELSKLVALALTIQGYKPAIIRVIWRIARSYTSLLADIRQVTIDARFRMNPWRRHKIETLFALLALCEENLPVTSPFKGPVTRASILSLC